MPKNQSKDNKTITIVIPAYNEEKRIGKTLEKWDVFLNSLEKNSSFDFLIIDDGSEDKTTEVASSFKDKLAIDIIRLNKNKGKGYAVKTGMHMAKGDFILVYDADAAVSPDQLLKLINILETTGADVVIGSRDFKNAKIRMSLVRRVVGLCFHLYCFPLIPNIRDASCGAKIFKKSAAKIVFPLIKTERFAFDIEMLWLTKKMDLKVTEMAVDWCEVSGSKVNIIKDSLEMFFSVLNLYVKDFYYKFETLCRKKPKF